MKNVLRLEKWTTLGLIFFGKENFLDEFFFGKKKDLSNFFVLNKNFVKKNVGKKMLVGKKSGRCFFGQKKIGQKRFGQKKIWVKKMWVLGSPEVV